MINSSKIKNKLLELNNLKKELISKIEFTTPGNSKKVYSTVPLKEKQGTHGSTPEDISVMLNKIMETCVSYVNKIKDLPYIESTDKENINRFFVCPTTGIKENGTILSNVPAMAILNDISISDVNHGFKKISVDLFLESSNIENTELYIVRINPRLSLRDYFNLSESNKKITFSESFINIDDIYIIGLKSKIDLENNTYQTNGKISISLSWDKKDENSSFQFQNESSQEVYLPKNETKKGNTFMWSIFSISDIDASLQDNIGNKYNLQVDKSINNTIMDGASISVLSINNKDISIADLNLSSENFTGIFRTIYHPRYDFIKTKDLTNKVLMNNVINIDTIIKDALDEL